MVKKSKNELRLVAGTGTLLDGTIVKIDDNNGSKEIDGIKYVPVLPHIANENVKPRCIFIADGYLQFFILPKVNYIVQVAINKKTCVGDEIAEVNKVLKISNLNTDISLSELCKYITQWIDSYQRGVCG